MLASLPTPTCGCRHAVFSSASRVGSSFQLNSFRVAALTVRRQQRSGAMRLQPLAAAPQPIPAAILDRRSKPQGVAHLRFQRGSPHKVRRVLDLIRGQTYERALITLEFSPWKASEQLIDVLISAAANAKNNLGLRKAKLYVSECTADGGPVLKRIRPRAKGRGARILKPTYHVSIKLAEQD